MSAPSVPPVQRKRKQRDLSRAEWLRPRDIFELYGIASRTLWVLVNHKEPSKRLPSVRVSGRGGRMGVTIIKRAEMEAFLARYSRAAS